MYGDIETLFATTASEGRSTLNWAEVTSLLNAADIGCAEESGTTDSSLLGRELKIELTNSREFGPVITVARVGEQLDAPA